MVSSVCTDVFLLIDGNRTWQTDWWWFLIIKGHSCLMVNPIQKDGHTHTVLIFFSHLTVCFNSSFIPSKYYVQSVSSDQGLRYNVHANSTILAAAILFGSFYCRLHSVYASMWRMKRAMEWKSGSSEQRCLPANSPQRLLKPLWLGRLRTWG